MFTVSSELREEMRPETLPDVSEVASFDASKLKHVNTKENTVLPTKEGNQNLISSCTIKLISEFLKVCVMAEV